MPDKILLVEDDALIALAEARMLKKHGFIVSSVYTGEKALEVIASDTEISLILMDIDLGTGMDGTETAKKILQLREIPIIFLTSHSEKEYVDRTEKISGYGYILKNSGEFVLVESIRMAYKLFTAYLRMKESEEKYRTAFMTSPDSVNINSPEGLYVDINEGFTTLTGFTRDDVIGKLSSEIDIWAIPEDRNILVKGLKEEGFVENLESVFRCKDGTLKTALMSARLISLNGQPHILSITRDISEKKRIEKAAEMAKRFLETISDIAYEADTQGHITYVNPAVEIITGFSVEEVMGAPFLPLFREEDHSSLMEIYNRTLEGEVLENNLTFVNGATCHFTTLPRYDEKGVVCGTYGIGRDISERIHREKDQEKQLRDSIREKDLLMRELNHRVKNNLLMISSLIHLKNASLGGEVDLSDLEHRIDTIRIIHEKLNKGDDVTTIDFRDYIEEILSNVFSFAPLPIRMENDIQDISLDTKRAVPVGLIINELATNAVKHGFSNDTPAVFRVHLSKEKDRSSYILKVGNTGHPFPEEIRFDRCETLGLQLITNLVKQLNGSLDVQKAPETLFSLRFPV